MTVNIQTFDVTQPTSNLPITEEEQQFNWRNCWYPVTFVQDLPKNRPYSFSLKVMSNTEIEAIVAAYFTNMAAMNPEDWLEHFAEDAISYDPVGHPPTKVHEGFREFFGQLQGVFDQLKSTTEHIFIGGNEAAVKWIIQGKSKSGKSVNFEGITVFEINDAGKIQTTRAYWNPAEMIAQLRG